MKAKVARFYGWNDEEISRMPVTKFHDYWLMITPLEAQEALVQSKVMSYPYMKSEASRKFIGELKIASKKFIDFTNGRILSYKDVVANIARKLNNG